PGKGRASRPIVTRAGVGGLKAPDASVAHGDVRVEDLALVHDLSQEPIALFQAALPVSRSPDDQPISRFHAARASIVRCARGAPSASVRNRARAAGVSIRSSVATAR